MKKGEKRKQQKALKKRTQAKEARRRARAKGTQPPVAVRQARSYPIDGCWVQEGWKESGLATVVVARRQPNGAIVFGSFLVDHYCLGVKDAFCNADVPPGQFRNEYLPRLLHGYSPLSISVDLAHEIVYGAIDFAARFGFQPHPDFRLCQNILDPPEMHPRTGQVQFGKDGKPFYISGPDDNPHAIFNQLMRTAGEGNFQYLIGAESVDDVFFEEEEEGE